MPDIKTALQNALSKAASAPTPQIPTAWDDEGADAATFDYVKNNPGNTRTQIVAALAAQGFKKGSTGSLLGQMSKQGLLREANGTMFAAKDEYIPLKTSRNKDQVKPVVKPVAKKVQAKPRPTFIPPTEAPVQINAAWDAETLLNNLSIKQARALYDELRKIFGG